MTSLLVPKRVVWQEIDSLIRLDWSQAENLFGSNVYQNPFCLGLTLPTNWISIQQIRK
jgi:hypothetical protein